ncbi:MAG TPA: hypothetical protein VLV17_02925 [Anaeromyxobacteraceae bacterium]|nr:hypothetical protein [Anaeromyxobacteraceae bacterium]
MRLFGALFAFSALASACHPEIATTGGASGYLITIENLAFTPQHLEAPPGATVLVLNLDPFEHWVRSEAAPESYVFGAVNGVSFDTGPFESATAFSIPQSAPIGTVVPYYCQIHEASMLDAPDLTVVAPDAGTP